MNELFNNLNSYQKGKLITMQFDALDLTNGLLWHEEGEGEEHFRVECPATDLLLEEEIKKKQYVLRGQLYKNLSVTVTRYDKEKRVFTVSIAQGVRTLRRGEKKDMLERLNAGEDVIVSGKVTGFIGEGDGSSAVIKVNDSHLILQLPVRYWEVGYVDDIREVVKKEQTIENLHILNGHQGYGTLSSKCDFLCTRIAIHENPWEGAKGKIHPDDLVTITIMGSRRRTPSQKTPSSFGDMACIINGLNIPAYASTRSSLRLQKGLVYKAVVKTCNIEDKKVRVTAVGLVAQNEMNKRIIKRALKGTPANRVTEEKPANMLEGAEQ